MKRERMGDFTEAHDRVKKTQKRAKTKDRERKNDSAKMRLGYREDVKTSHPSLGIQGAAGPLYRQTSSKNRGRVMKQQSERFFTREVVLPAGVFRRGARGCAPGTRFSVGSLACRLGCRGCVCFWFHARHGVVPGSPSLRLSREVFSQASVSCVRVDVLS